MRDGRGSEGACQSVAAVTAALSLYERLASVVIISGRHSIRHSTTIIVHIQWRAMVTQPRQRAAPQFLVLDFMSWCHFLLANNHVVS